MTRPRTADEHVDRVRQVVLEAQDLQHLPAFPDQLQDGVDEVHESMKQRTCTFGRDGLPLMDVAHADADETPFRTALRRTDESRRKGLEVEEQDE
jgi:hypothetical protein